MDRRIALTLDAADPHALGTFWAAALGYVEEPPPAPHQTWPEALVAWGMPEERWNDAYAVVDPDGVGPRLYLQRVPEPKTAKNRLHLDVSVPGLAPGVRPDRDRLLAHVALLEALGATRDREVDDPASGFWVVMTDPEGNEFCVV